MSIILQPRSGQMSIDKEYKLTINNYKERELIVNGKKIKVINKINKRINQAIIHLDKR